MSVLALVTARGGSRGVPRKNLATLGGRPLLAWTLEAARQSGRITRTLLSTDDPEIADVGVRMGAEVPFLRPAELATDDAAHIDVVVHALEWLQQREGDLPMYTLLLQPTSPFRTSADIDAAVALAARRNAESVVGLTPAVDHPFFVKGLNADDTLYDFATPPAGYLPRQALPSAYVVNGAIYLVRTETFLRLRSWFLPGTVGYVMPRERSLDIDEPSDLEAAEWFLQRHRAAGALVGGGDHVSG